LGRYVSLTAIILLWSSTAWTFDNDPALHRLCVGVGAVPEQPCGAKPQGNTDSFRRLTKEYAQALTPTLLAPAETMGINGFQFNLQFAMATINADSDYWQAGVSDEDPEASLVTTRIGVRKGLPGSIEIGMNTSYLFESELWMFGVMAKWSPHEGVADIPIDLSFRGHYNRLIGSPDLVMSTTGLDVILSKSFGVAGVVNFAPYAAYSPLWIFSRSNVLDSTPGVLDSPDGDFVFPQQEQLAHRVTLGTRFIMGAFNLTPEATIESTQNVFAVNLGADF
jgi:hypothetical protein